ncbi:C39 family peptidase [Legionella worsleiensis]|uniref:Peptidase C39 family protein n=1 Tax=Legionella worsleiensis TaxID=45076 RepID=A0A0W1AK38_9GAMM|nr:C39 family peptidase [Legionella worsleiensis]KTD81630.1 Peptidase C39 family protein [Legionella worsleiensis]STY31961.1 Peptidase C39 family [Legionella worsleiensis]
MIELIIQTQPDDESCGPTCLHAVYQYYGLEFDLNELIRTIDRSISGGTLSAMLGKHALHQGFNANIYVYNLDVFDPSWFHNGVVNNKFLMDKLEVQMAYKDNPYITQVSQAYIEYLNLGGKVSAHPLNTNLLKKYFVQNIPIITGLSATNLYWSARELFTPEGKSVYDDVRGTPCGHFVVLCGYDVKKRHVVVADPHAENPLFHNNYYKVNITRLMNSIMLGVMTYDGNLLIIEPKTK